jgi:predicted component of type VI protein secretion system
MTQDGSVQDRVERVAQSLAPSFDAVRLKLARAFAQAEAGQVIEQTERIIFEELNHLKTTSQEVGLQERVHEAQAAFSPSGATGQASP